ncbi:uncharacterized protein LOC117596799 isoform X1 [Pangasianodon hypophthalmus]|uniref:uncharacterized protein LOC128317943 isoform X1 n=1 Tax=Pangasianodon hypophthalmus TaxID=310915 RepID=UPI0023074CDD|nr:uncharacterized protein LOC128317943 isoform X1 [Pangasianodon hypophthalmus]XP_053092601.1 uncharacterized protein LOC117596799 isoform X1 [Pangasianodon hypophthalmus]XP_053092602.1 uncharacterized protein LOC117596799 isoform X1 [Pangasianodon hypophthalmus]
MVKCNKTDNKKHTNIINLSKTFCLTGPQEDLLSKGLTFIPTPCGTDLGELGRDVHAYNRQLKILDHFQYTKCKEHLQFTEKSRWEPSTEQTSLPIKQLIKKNRMIINSLSDFSNNQADNLTATERRALKELQTNRDIIIKPADKGSAIVIMDKQQYLLEANRQLNNTNHYTLLPHSLQQETQSLVTSILQDLKQKGFINTKQFNYLIGPNPPRQRKFYLLPKIHKDPQAWTVPSEVPQGRPIVSDCGSETYNVAQYIDYFLNPVSQLHPSYLKDTYDFINKIKNMTIPDSAFLFTVDVESLYTNISTEAGLQAITKCFNRYPDSSRPDAELLQLLEINLTRNDFEFNSQLYLQVQGTAMGKKFAPAYANIYMSEWEETLFPKCPHLPAVYYRYLDDIFGVWHHDREHFDTFLNLANSHHKHIKVKATLNSDNINFLDTTVFAIPTENNSKTLHTKVFFKPTDSHSLLFKTSYHPRHTFKGVIKSQIIRFHRICSFDQHFHEATQTLFKALRPRGYSKRFLRAIKRDTLQDLRNNPTRLVPEPKDVIPIVTTFSETSKILNNKLKQQFQKTQELYAPLRSFKPISAYRRNKNLRDLLVRASLKSDRRVIPPILATHFQQLRSVEMGNKGHLVPQRTNLKTTNIIYMITCTHCHKRYIGETEYSLEQRLKQHIYSIQHRPRNTHLICHFARVGIQKLRISGLEANRAWNREQRRRREAYWISKLHTDHPHGFNTRRTS